MPSKRAILKNRKLGQAECHSGLASSEASSNSREGGRSRQQAFITFLTDFGLNDIYVGVMKGVVAGINPSASSIDLCHEVAPHDIRAAAFLLAGSYSFFPEGTIHVAVVDPEVGSARRALCVRAGEYFFVGPDNGILSIACSEAGHPEIFLLENEAHFLKKKSRTFHGRDIFAPVAAHLSAGAPIESFGRRVRSMRQIRMPVPQMEPVHVLRGEILHVDRFGNLITNIQGKDLLIAFGAANNSRLVITCVNRRITGLSETYGDVKPGVALALFGSHNFMEIAISSGNAAAALGAKRGSKVLIELQVK
jgi:hypothetical protein